MALHQTTDHIIFGESFGLRDQVSCHSGEGLSARSEVPCPSEEKQMFDRPLLYGASARLSKTDQLRLPQPDPRCGTLMWLRLEGGVLEALLRPAPVLR